MEIDIAKEKLKDYIRTKFLVEFSDGGLSETCDLFATGVVDSFGYMELIDFIEDEFKIQIPDDDLATESFTSIAGMANYLNGKNL